jgi:hypothetical protein
MLAGKLAEEFLLIHTILEGFTAIDKYNRDFIVELTPEFGVGVDIDFMPCKAATAGELGKAFLNDFAQMTAFARVNDDAAEDGHRG